MPTPVKAHWSRRGGKRFRVKKSMRFGPEHTARWKRLVADVKEENRRRGTHYSPEAVATARLGYAGTFGKGGPRRYRRR